MLFLSQEGRGCLSSLLAMPLFRITSEWYLKVFKLLAINIFLHFLLRKLLRKDRRAEPQSGERVPYVIVYGEPGLPLIQLVRQPWEVLDDPSLRLNAAYYITKHILPPLNRIFSLIGVNVFKWYYDMPKVIRYKTQNNTDNKVRLTAL